MQLRRLRFPQRAVALLTSHKTGHQLKQTPTPAHTPTTTPPLTPIIHTPNPPELSRPELKSHITNEEWNVFSRRWDIYRGAYNFQGR